MDLEFRINQGLGWNGIICACKHRLLRGYFYLAPRNIWSGVSTGFTGNDQLPAHLLEILGTRAHSKCRWVLKDTQINFKLPDGRMYFTITYKKVFLTCGPHLQNDLGGFWAPQRPVTVVRCTCVHSNCIVIGCRNENWALWVYHPTWVLERIQGGNNRSFARSQHLFIILIYFFTPYLHCQDLNHSHLWSSWHTTRVDQPGQGRWLLPPSQPAGTSGGAFEPHVQGLY